jgi:L-iditol 2-dehydrogenase
MKAAFLTGIRKIEILQAPEPAIAHPTDVLLAVESVGVCGSDMHYYKDGRIGCQIVEFPWIVGHECSGRALAVGPGVTRIRVGDRVAVDPLVHCGQCDQCLTGRTHTCRNQKFLGCPGQLQGSLCERLVMPEASCFTVPDGMTAEQAALAEPLCISLWAQKLSDQVNGAKIGILGAGPIGLGVLAAVKEAGSCIVYQTDLLDNRLALARKFGADWTGNAGKIDPVKEIAAAEPLGLDLVFECAGLQETIDQCLSIVKPCSQVVLVGIPIDDRASFDMNHMRRKELRVQNVRRQLEQVPRALDMIATGKIDMGAMVTHRFTLDQAQEAFELVADYRDHVVKAMVNVCGC